MSTEDSFTIGAQSVAPYVHVDSRSAVICDGRHTVIVPRPRLAIFAETLRVLLTEGRATRGQNEFTCGGFTAGDDVVLYVSDARAALSVRVAAADVQALHDRLMGPG